MAAAINHDISVTEYEPRKIKLAITGNGAAAKEQVQEMLKRILNIPQESILRELDATDALGAALCHFYESGKPAVAKGPGSWKEFIAKNPDRLR
jgi:crossover junction endodeoxyribonuclease RuvC